MSYCKECGSPIPEPNVFSSVEKYILPATPAIEKKRCTATLLREGLSRLEGVIENLPCDPGKLYPLHERVRRVIGALQADIILAKDSRR
jgi:hypothetical protein